MIKNMNGKTPGGDGLPAEFYKQFRELLAPKLLRMYEEACEGGILPESARKAIVIPLSKKDQEGDVVQAYRPLSMLTIDFKILSKILANRLAPKMCELIHPDQNGFIPTRSPSQHIRRLFRVLEGADIDRHPRALVASLDLEKAFDSLDWTFLIRVMQQMGLGDGWTRWVTLLYTNPTVQVKTG